MAFLFTTVTTWYGEDRDGIGWSVKNKKKKKSKSGPPAVCRTLFCAYLLSIRTNNPREESLLQTYAASCSVSSHRTTALRFACTLGAVSCTRCGAKGDHLAIALPAKQSCRTTAKRVRAPSVKAMHRCLRPRSRLSQSLSRGADRNPSDALLRTHAPSTNS